MIRTYEIGEEVGTLCGRGEYRGQTPYGTTVLIKLFETGEKVSFHPSKVWKVYESQNQGLEPGQHRFKLGEKVYCSKMDKWGRKGAEVYYLRDTRKACVC